MAEARPDQNPKSAFGMTKPSISLIPPTALVEEAVVFGLGAAKYGPYNWRETGVSARVYVDAAMRHILSWFDGEDRDPESLMLHLSHGRACLGILVDVISCGKLIDDRPVSGAAAALIRDYTKKPTAPVEIALAEEGVCKHGLAPDVYCALCVGHNG